MKKTIGMILFCVCATSVFAKTVYVSKSGSNTSPYDSWATAASSIQDAVNTTIDGDLVLVSNGTYYPSSEILITNNITVRGSAGADATVIDGGNSHRCFNLSDPGCEIIGFTITKGYSSNSGGGVYCNNSSSMISNCKIIKNMSNAHGGGLYLGAAKNCTIRNNTASLNGGGASSSALKNCTVCRNYAYGNGGGMSYGSTQNCIVWYNEAAGAGNNFNSTHTVTANTCSPEVTAGTDGCITNAPLLSDVMNGNFRLVKTSPCRDAGDNSYAPTGNDLDGNLRILGGTVDMGAYEVRENSVHSGSPTHYVSMTGSATWPYTTWATAARIIQDAVDTAEAGDTILVYDGVYNGGGDGVYSLNRVNVTNSITLRSVNGPEQTVIMGAIDPISTTGEAAIRGIYVASGCAPLISGFTVTNGYTWAGATARSGGGIFCGTDSATITNCIVAGNHAYDNGGGIYRCTVQHSEIRNNSSYYGNGGGLYKSEVTESLIDDNSAYLGGGMYEGAATNCLIRGNFATYGGGLYLTLAESCEINNNRADKGGGAYRGTLESCLVVSNLVYMDGGGIFDGTAEDSVFRENVAYEYGGALANGAVADRCEMIGNRANKSGGGLSFATANNCYLSENWAYYDGGGMSTGTLRNCTVVNNRASRSGGGVSGGIVKNSIIWYNSASVSGDNLNSNYTAATYSCSPDLTYGTGCITNNPQLSDVVNGNTRLLRTSPCRSSGNNDDVVGIWDLDGKNRITDGIVDMGAYESPEIGLVFPSTPQHYVSMEGTASWPYTSWATAARNIQDAIDSAEDGDTIWVADGIYGSGGAYVSNYGLSRVTATRDVAIKSLHGPEQTIITGAPDPLGDYGDGAIRGVYLEGSASLSGFTVSGGYTQTYSGSENNLSCGAGIICESSGNVVSECVISGNAAAGDGGGMLKGSANNSDFINNTSQKRGGGAYNIVATYCMVTNNSAESDAGGLYYGRADHCEIVDNLSHANGGGTHSTNLKHCLITDNFSTGFGGGVHYGTVRNSIISYNTALKKGGGIYAGHIFDSTVANNSSLEIGGGIYNPTEVRNCIIWDNSAETGYSDIYGWENSYNSCASDLIHGANGCITNNPLFKHRASGYRLQPDSPCIDTGVFVSNDDFDGVGRPLDGDHDGTAISDMGAFEYINAASDSDGDSMNDYDEYVADTDAADSTDYFHVEGISTDPDLKVHFTSSDRRLYTLQSRTNLTDSSSWENVPGAQHLGNGGEDWMLDPNPTLVKYYRITVALP